MNAILRTVCLIAYLGTGLAAGAPLAQAAASAPSVPDRGCGATLPACVSKHYHATITDIGNATTVLARAGAHAGYGARQALDISRTELNALAGKLHDGFVQGRATLTDTFARANYAIARSRRVQASRGWVAGQTRRAGRDVETAARSVHEGAAWIGAKFRASVQGAHALGGKLAAGGAWTRHAAARGFTSLQHAVNTLDSRLQAAD